MNVVITVPMLEEAASAIATAGRGGRGRAWRAWSEKLGLSESALRRKLMATGLYDTGRERKRPDPTLPAAVELVLAVKNRLSAQDRRVPAEVAIEAAELSGLIAAGAVTPDQVWRYGRLSGATDRKERHHRYETLTPNGLHVADWSGSEYLYPIEYDEARQDWLLGVAGRARESAKNRPRRRSRPGTLWYAGLIDHHSRYTYASLLVLPGESLPGWADFLLEAWGRKPDTRIPFRGLPDRLMTDGMFLNSPTGKEFLKTLAVDPEPHGPYNPNAQGSIERQWRTVFERHELKYLLSAEKEVWLSAVRARLRDWLAEWNARLSPSLLNEDGLSRVDMWMRIWAAGVRDIPDGLRSGQVAVKRYVRTVHRIGLGSVLLDRKYYEIEDVEPEMLGAEVIVVQGFGGETAVQWRGRIFVCRRYEPQIMGDPRALPMSESERLHRMGVGLGALSVFGSGPEPGNLTRLPVRGEPVSVQSPLQATGRSYRTPDDAVVEFGKALAEKGLGWDDLGTGAFESVMRFIEENFGDQEKINAKLKEFRQTG